MGTILQLRTYRGSWLGLPGQVVLFGPKLVRAALRVTVGTVLLWVERAKSRRRLAVLDDRMLRDIGLDRAAVWSETQKPFFRN